MGAGVGGMFKSWNVITPCGNVNQKLRVESCPVIKDGQGHYQRKGLLGTRLEQVLGVERKAASYSTIEGTSHWVISFSSAQTFKMNLPGM